VNGQPVLPDLPAGAGEGNAVGGVLVAPELLPEIFILTGGSGL